jgi:hypothetical protein
MITMAWIGASMWFIPVLGWNFILRRGKSQLPGDYANPLVASGIKARRTHERPRLTPRSADFLILADTAARGRRGIACVASGFLSPEVANRPL